MKMVSRGEDQFSFILTSDGSMDVYPDNKTSQFKVMLKDPIDVGDEAWEVSLQSINYPYSWTNMGPSAKVHMKFYVDSRNGEREINFPDWQCETLREVVDFISHEITKIEKSSRVKSPSLQVSLDELGRFKLACMSKSFDVGFSDNMLRLLGLLGHPAAEDMKIAKFDVRQEARNFLDHVMLEDVVFDYNDVNIRREIKKASTINELLEVVEIYIDWKKVNDYYSEEDYIDMDRVRKHRYRFQFTEKLPEFTMKGLLSGFRGIFGLEDLMYNFKLLAGLNAPREFMKGATPGVINPVQRMYVYMNIIEPVDMNDKSVKLLKMINTRGSRFKTTQEEFINPLYTRIRKGKISMIDVFIADDQGDPVPFQVGTVVLTLHFRRVNRR